MHFSRLTWLVTAIGSAAGAFISKTSVLSPAIYLMDNKAAGASIVSLSILSNGLLSTPVRTATGGVGERAVGANGGPAGPDSLFTQNSVVVGDNFLLSVNPGSNTLSLFNINPLTPTQPTLAGTPANTLGQFPASVAYSSKLKTACVLNGGAVGGVACFSVSSSGLKALDTTLRSVSPALNQPTPPIFINQTASDILFNPTSTALFAIVKGNANTGLPATFFAWPVVNGKVSTTPVISHISDIFLAFGATFIDNTHIWLADVAFGAAKLTMASDYKLSEIVHRPVTGEQALCWATYVPSLNNVYLTDGFQSNVTVIDATTGALKPYFNFASGDNGGFDNVQYGGKLYVLTGVGSVVVLDLTTSPPKTLQDISLSDGSSGDSTEFEGMALYV